MYLPWSQSEEALRDTLVHKAEGDAFERIARFYGFTWPKFIAEGAWRGGLKTVAYNARDTFPVVFEALTQCLAGYIETFDDCYYPVGFLTGISRAGGWSEAYIGRYVRIGTTIYYSTGISGLKLLLSPYTTSYWTGINNTLNIVAQSSIDLVEVLPFVVYERGNGPSYVDPNLNGDEGDSWQGQTYSWFLNNTLEIEVWPHIASIPESYLLEPEDYALASEGVCPGVDGGNPGVCTPSTMPNGGYLLEDDTEDMGVDIADAYPIYLYDGEVSRELEFQFDRLLPAGNHVLMRATERSWPEL